MKNIFITIYLLILNSGLIVTSSRVLELSDKFLDIRSEGQWFIKFYAPWCAHCRRLDPVWAHVAQALYNTPVRVAKVDCTRFTAVATHFKIRTYPTILFLKGQSHHEYVGERTKDDMVNFAIRMSQPAIQRLTYKDRLDYLKDTYSIFFAYVGKESGIIWEMYAHYAQKHQPFNWFFAMPHEVGQPILNAPDEPSILVYKDDETFYFEVDHNLKNDKQELNESLGKWISAERFGAFPKVTRSNINQIIETEKYIVLVVVSENKVQDISQTEKDFKDMIEGLVRKKKVELHHVFQFGWLGSTELANSITMSELTVPHLLVLNSTTSHHHIPDDDPVLMTEEAVLNFLDQVHKQHARAYGGNSWPIRLYRSLFEIKNLLVSMWQGNPVLTALVFGLPLGFLSLICYSVCCADILDADEEEDPADTHEKKD